MDTATAPVIETSGLAKSYLTLRPVSALRGVDLRVDRGERVAVVGPSGSGKSTLLNLLGLLDTPSAGDVRLLGRPTNLLSQRQRDHLRAQVLGFVFQDAHVLGSRTVTENLEIAQAIRGTPPRDRAARAREALEAVGLADRADSLGRLLSGGERQRLGIARAIINRPSVILADEPTGSLDAENANRVMTLLDRQAATGVAVVVITHDSRVAAWADRCAHLTEGRIARWSEP